jgi:hypothetical protein
VQGNPHIRADLPHTSVQIDPHIRAGRPTHPYTLRPLSNAVSEWRLRRHSELGDCVTDETAPEVRRSRRLRRRRTIRRPAARDVLRTAETPAPGAAQTLDGLELHRIRRRHRPGGQPRSRHLRPMPAAALEGRRTNARPLPSPGSAPISTTPQLTHRRRSAFHQIGGDRGEPNPWPPVRSAHPPRFRPFPLPHPLAPQQRRRRGRGFSPQRRRSCAQRVSGPLMGRRGLGEGSTTRQGDSRLQAASQARCGEGRVNHPRLRRAG